MHTKRLHPGVIPCRFEARRGTTARVRQLCVGAIRWSSVQIESAARLQHQRTLWLLREEPRRRRGCVDEVSHPPRLAHPATITVIFVSTCYLRAGESCTLPVLLPSWLLRTAHLAPSPPLFSYLPAFARTVLPQTHIPIFCVLRSTWTLATRREGLRLALGLPLRRLPVSRRGCCFDRSRSGSCCDLVRW